MIITGKRKRKLDKKLFAFKEGANIIPAVSVTDQTKDLVLKIGFTEQIVEGEAVLPPHGLGPVCRFNA